MFYQDDYATYDSECATRKMIVSNLPSSNSIVVNNNSELSIDQAGSSEGEIIVEYEDLFGVH